SRRARAQGDRGSRRVLRRRSGQAPRRPRVAVSPPLAVLVRAADRQARPRARAVGRVDRARRLVSRHRTRSAALQFGVGSAAVADPDAPPPSRLRRILRKLWWLHSTFALSFGIGVMLFARAGLAHADEVMIALFASWLLLFVALRFIVGPANRR